MKRIFWIKAGFLCFFTTCASATHLPNFYKSGVEPSENGWIVGVGAGLGWNNFEDSSTTVPNGSGATPPMDNDTYTINTPSNSAIEQLNVGYRWHQDKKFLPYYQLFLQYRHTNDTGVVGTVDQYSLPEFVNYAYRVSYDTDLYTLTGKFDLVEYQRLMPYVSVGAGIITTHTYDYSESPQASVTPRISPGYQGGTNNSFAVTLGAGLDFTLTQNTWLTLGYEHVFQGKAKTGQGTSSWTGTYLNLGNVRADTIFLNFTAKFPDAFRSEA